MSFSKNVETMAGWDNLHEWDHMQFMCVTVEPLPSIKEYGQAMPEEKRRSFIDASVRQWAYHKMRKK